MRRNATTGAVGCAALVLTMVTVTTGSTAGAAPPRTCVPTWQQVEVTYSDYQTPLHFTPAVPDPPVQKAVSVLPGSDVRIAADFGGSGDPHLQRWTGRTVDAAPRQLPIPPTFRSNVYERSQSFSSPDEGWLVANTADRGSHSGQNRVVTYRWHDGRWTMVPTAVSPDPLVHGLDVVDVVSVSADDAWLVGTRYRTAQGPILERYGAHIQHWDGTRWSIVDNPLATTTGARLHSVTALSPDDVWAVGGQRNESGAVVPLVMHWDGAQWHVVDAPTGATPAALNAISGASPDNIWAIGGQTRPDGLAIPLAMRWNGTEWRIHELPDIGNASFHGIYAASATEAWAIGLFPVGADTYFLHWDGRSWQPVRPPGAAGGVGLNTVYEDIHGTGPNDVWAVGAHYSRTQSSEDRPLVAHLSCGRNR